MCGTPFNRLVVKTRASASFTAELKDFVAPTDLFLAPRANAVADVPVFCGSPDNVSYLQVLNPTASSVYTWTTTNGNIVGNPVSSSITVDTTGSYIVTQQLMTGCSAYATDTVLIVYDASCVPLVNGLMEFKGTIYNKKSQLSWIIASNETTKLFEVQRSTNGTSFYTVKILDAMPSQKALVDYAAEDDIAHIKTATIFYRLKVTRINGATEVSKVIKLQNEEERESLSAFPNPVQTNLQISISSLKPSLCHVVVYDISGKEVFKKQVFLKEGRNNYTITETAKWQKGAYILSAQTDRVLHRKVIVVNGGLALKGRPL